MMMMPFVRLLAIYALVGAAIFAFLKRDQLAEYFAPAEAEPVAAAPAAAPAPVAHAQPAPAPQPESQPAPQPESAASASQNYSAPAAFGSDVTPQYFGQTHTQATPLASPAPRSGGDMVARWTEARQVFSQGNITEAASLYEALTADFPDNADLHGETGNLYYNLGQFTKAATHFFAVGKITASKGDMAMAMNMLGLLQRISPSKAAELQAILGAQR